MLSKEVPVIIIFIIFYLNETILKLKSIEMKCQTSKNQSFNLRKEIEPQERVEKTLSSSSFISSSVRKSKF